MRNNPVINPLLTINNDIITLLIILFVIGIN